MSKWRRQYSNEIRVARETHTLSTPALQKLVHLMQHSVSAYAEDVIDAWSELPAALKSGILAMMWAERGGSAQAGRTVTRR